MLTYTSDGTAWRTASARELSQIPIWKGNRVLDEAHSKKIADSLNGHIYKLSMNPYRIVYLKEDDDYQYYIIDGQHRHCILSEYFKDATAPDFTVLVGTNTVDTEDQVIDLFKTLNTTKSIPWKEDPILTANKYIAALMIQFNTDKKRPFIRSGKTRKPYISVDNLRDILVSKKVEDWKRTVEEFVDESVKKNEDMLNALKNISGLQPSGYDAIKMKFVLGLDDKFSWI